MDKTVATFIGVVCVVVGLHASRAMHQTNITGKVYSERDSLWVFAVSGSDSVKTKVNNGQFRFAVKPGSWKVTVREQHMYNNDGMIVEAIEGSTFDMGTITLN